MSKDHYVARTYLRRFGGKSPLGMLRGYRKHDGAHVPRLFARH
jgi:hypothetical protein